MNNKPSVLIEIIAPQVTEFFHCMHCESLFNQTTIAEQVHLEMISEYPDDFIAETLQLTQNIETLLKNYGEQLTIRVIDPQTPEGLLKSLRYWVRKYPAIIINRQEKITGWDEKRINQAIQHQLHRNEQGHN